MGKMSTKLLILWFATALSIVGFVAGFNIIVDPFGHFGRNTLGYYFSSERQFKYSIIKTNDYNAILLGDSRIAFTDPSYIARPEYKFVNGGMGGSSFAEQVALLAASRLDRLKLAVFGLEFGDHLADCSEDKTPAVAVTTATTTAPPEYGAWEALRFAASLSQLAYALNAVMTRAVGKGPKYHEDGTRSAISKYVKESAIDGKTARYWDKIQEDIPDQPGEASHYLLAPECRELLSQARDLADRHGFTLIVVFLPTNGDLLKHLNLDTPRAREETSRFLAQVEEIVPQVVDLSRSAFSDSQNFWLDDSIHFKPDTGALVVQQAINRSIGAQAKR
jgi:hypothetical protein